MKQEKIRKKQLVEQREARRVKNTIRKDKRIAKKPEQLTGIITTQPVKEVKAVAPKEEAPKKVAASAKKETAQPSPLLPRRSEPEMRTKIHSVTLLVHLGF